MVSQKIINEIVFRIVNNYHPEKIILFGSHALGTAEDESDVDLFIVKDSELPRYKRISEVLKYLQGIMAPFDVMVYTNREINEWKDLKNSFVNTVFRTGKVIYER